MSREIRRVPLDFDFPLGETWSGYLMPDELCEQWEPTDPPTGDGWQLWQSVSEGGPVSPVFAEREGLVAWLMSDAYNYGVSRPLSREQAEAFVSAGYSIGSGVITSDCRLISGDAAVHELKEVQ